MPLQYVRMYGLNEAGRLPNGNGWSGHLDRDRQRFGLFIISFGWLLCPPNWRDNYLDQVPFSNECDTDPRIRHRTSLASNDKWPPYQNRVGGLGARLRRSPLCPKSNPWQFQVIEVEGNGLKCWNVTTFWFLSHFNQFITFLKKSIYHIFSMCHI